mgnify:CR=1 FL=1
MMTVSAVAKLSPSPPVRVDKRKIKKGESGALNMYIRCAQYDFPEISCLALHPGWVQTDRGGPSAPLTPEQSASSLRQTLNCILEQRDPKHRGAFLNHDGQSLPW